MLAPKNLYSSEQVSAKKHGTNHEAQRKTLAGPSLFVVNYLLFGSHDNEKQQRKLTAPFMVHTGPYSKQARTGRGIQGGKRRLQAARLVDGTPPKRPLGCLGDGLPAGRIRVGHGGPA
jgi:hypothetical protein